MNKIRFIFVGIISMLFVSCTTSKEINYASSKRLSSQDQINEKSIVYGLPKSTLVFKVEQLKTEYIAGPYAQYAETFLGISNVVTSSKTEYKLSNVLIDQYRELDNDALYIIEPGDQVIDYLQLSKQGLIMFPENRDAQPVFNTQSNDYSQKLIFTDLSVKPNYFHEKGEITRVSTAANNFSDVPVIRKQTVMKSIQDKAKEAADVIFDIRERRLSLLFGDEERFPQGDAMSATLNEMRRIEEEYLALFIGKQVESVSTFYYEFTPTKEYTSSPYMLFRFSEKSGVTDVKTIEGRPVYVVIENGNNSASENIESNSTTNSHNIYYRVPYSVNVKLIDKDVIVQRRMIIEQLGKVMSVPAKNINL